ncbi:MAG TPA: hypothetical protein VFQ72_03350 [Candidatus Paceibacterota bacterium]|nr:hypothetical protein [Candidatus Paceibacterota bacterium]
MDRFWVFYAGQLTCEPVYTNQHYSEEVRFAGHGRQAYIFRENRDITLIFDEESQVFHSPTIDLRRYEGLIRKRKEEFKQPHDCSAVA